MFAMFSTLCVYLQYLCLFHAMIYWNSLLEMDPICAVPTTEAGYHIWIECTNQKPRTELLLQDSCQIFTMS